ncbi:MAG TPA: hydroxymethylbilane synthase [Devosia sp.]|nr:hydroxymethylbilane synthase [Devosia sp.]
MAGSSATPFARIGTRGSPLALRQAEMVRAGLAAAHGVSPDEIEIVVISTGGDRVQDRPLSELGGKGMFTKEIEQALLSGAIDLGVHSGKDVAAALPPGLVLPVFLERADIRDAFVSLNYAGLDDLPQGAKLGTSSVRRAAQMKRYRPDLEIVSFRGNVDTRLDKLARGVADATLLAAAGLDRLGRAERITAYLDPKQFPTAPAQGAIAIEIRDGDARIAGLVAPLDHRPTRLAVAMERAFLAELDGSCRTPIGAYSEIAGDRLALTGEILSPDGSRLFRATESGSAAAPEAIGTALGRRLLEEAGPDFVALFAI